MELKGLLAVILFLMCASCTNAYITTLHAPAVLSNANKGTLTVMQINLTPGNGNVQVGGPSSVDSTTTLSAQTAAAYAASALGLNASKYNFNYTIQSKNISVSGPSAGLVFTLLAYSALQHRQLIPNFTATGTISSQGNVGLIGGIYDKSGAAKAAGMKFILAPYTSNSSFEYLLYYISQQVTGLPFVEVANVSQAIPYAYGTTIPKPIPINLSQVFNINSLGYANITCTACNTSAFRSLANFTFNFTNSYISNTSSSFAGAKQDLIGNQNQNKLLSNKGYFYTAADFSFLNFINAYTLANAQNYNVTRASALLNNESSYCSSIVAPQLTNTNYEYIIGGELRLYLANVTLHNAETLLASEQTTDDIIQSIYSAADAAGWCAASNQMFKIAAALNGTPVQISPNLRSNAATALNKVRPLLGSVYVQAAQQAYSSGDYATALYATGYATAFGNLTNATSTQQLDALALQNIKNSTIGIWPSQFATQAEFYFRESIITSSATSKAYASQAYTTSQLARQIELANQQINASFSPGVASFLGGNTNVALQISGLQKSISQIYLLLVVNATLLLAVLVMLIYHHALLHKPRAKKKR